MKRDTRLLIIWLTLLSLCFPTITQAQSKCDHGGNQGGIIGGITDIGRWIIKVVSALDPNDITGPTGYSTGQWMSINDQLNYTVRFENSAKFATAPAQKVYIHVPVHTGLNAASLELGPFGFGPYTFDPPVHSASYNTRLDLRDSLGLFVDITAGLDVTTNELFWRFQSIDPATGLPPLDPGKGFLPVNDTPANPGYDTLPGGGEGFVTFRLTPKKTLHTGDTVAETATIIFDINEAIPTNNWVNTIDALPPASRVTAYTTSNDTITLHFSGMDDPGGTGIREYALYVSEHAGPFSLYKEKLPDTAAALFVGDTAKQYRFFSLATDNVGNREALKTLGDVTVQWETGAPLSIKWIYFKGRRQGDDVLLSWATASEQNCREYILERSVDGKIFTGITRKDALKGAGTNNYDYTDEGAVLLKTSRLFYRLRQVALDNRFSYSNTVVIPLNNEVLAPVITVRPNPFRDQIILDLLNAGNADITVHVSLFSVEGLLQYEKNFRQAGSGAIVLDKLPALQPGAYVLKVALNDDLYVFKMTRQ